MRGSYFNEEKNGTGKTFRGYGDDGPAVRFTEEYREERIPRQEGFFSRRREEGSTGETRVKAAPGRDAGPVPLPVPEKIRAMKAMVNPYDYTNQASADIFYRQALFMEDYEDDYVFRGTVRRYYPTYIALTDLELRGYFGWRTRFRAGQQVEDVPSSLVYIYIYELLNGIGVTPEEGLEKLFKIDELYGSRDPVMRQHLKVWIPDYLVYYNMGQEMAPGYTDAETDQKKDILTDFLSAASVPGPEDRVTLPENTDTAELFRAMAGVSAYPLQKSVFVKKEPEEAERLFVRVLYGMAGRLKNRRKEPLQELCFGRRDVRTYRMFRSAMFYDHRHYRSYDYAVSPVKVFRCRDGIWMLEMYREDGQGKRLFGNICREIDRQARQQLLLGRTLKDSAVKPEMEALIADLVREYREEREEQAAAAARAAELAAKEEARKKIYIDMSLLSEIRQDAAVTRDSLIVEEEEDAAGTAEAAAAEKKEAAAADTPLSEAEYFFVHALLYGGEWRSYLKERRIALSMLADSINEKLMDVVGDTVIEFAGEDPQLIEDYIEELTELVPE